LKHGIPNFKPVILFRSKTINESKADYEEFLNLTENIEIKDFDFLENISEKIHESKQPNLFEMGKSRAEQILDFIKNEKYISLKLLILLKKILLKENVLSQIQKQT